MNKNRNLIFAIVSFFAAASAALALEVPLNTVQYPERKTVDVPFSATERAPSGANLEGEVRAKGPQASIELAFRNLPPAVLFGGQINSYVVWAISRDGNAQNLGELWSRDENGKSEFQTGLKEFAILVTAEPIPGMSRPSDLVVFVSQRVKSKYAKNSAFAFAAFRPAVRRDVESIGILHYREREPLELYQARRIYKTAELAGIAEYDARSMEEARTTLAQATNTAASNGSNRVIADYSRRTVSLVSTAARAMWKAAAEREQAEIAAGRRAQLDALGRQAARAEQTAAEADLARLRAESERDSAARAQSESEATADRLAREKQAAEQAAMTSEDARREAEAASRRSEDLRRQAEDEKRAAERAQTETAEQAAALERQKAALEAQRNEAERARSESARQAAALEEQKNQLSAEKESLASDRDRVQKDRDALQQRLTGALAGVATTRTTARGIVVSLPGILFETGKSALKPSAQVALAKMAGVLSVFPDMNLRVEGYTDSTGTDAVNRRLSNNRAMSVSAFLQKQGIAPSRIVAEGYGPQFPVASNTTPSGRARNRRVDVVLAEGVVTVPGS